jgi:DNA mismatch endonuclease (patch repair protein)
MDRLTPERRSEIMSRIRGRDTAPEMLVRRFLHAAGLRYRLHCKNLAGRPDLLFPGRHACVFVHGCFWHGCERCIDGRRSVKSNAAYWSPKIAGNKERDARNLTRLRGDGWHIFVVWECQLKDSQALSDLVERLRALPLYAK